MRAVPRRYRFAVARLISIGLQPFLRLSPRFRQQLRFGMDSEQEVALFHTLKSMTSSGTEFDPPLNVTNAEQVNEAIQAGRGVFFATTHMVLVPLAFRYLHDRGISVSVIASTPLELFGTRGQVPAIAPSPQALMEVRTLLRRGGILFAMLDVLDTETNRTVAFETRSGTLRIRDTLIRLAQRWGAEIFFVAARVEHGGVLVYLEKAVEEPVGEFVAFVQKHAGG
jgi:lauroyl/myristoyl acyltransferase